MNGGENKSGACNGESLHSSRPIDVRLNTCAIAQPLMVPILVTLNLAASMRPGQSPELNDAFCILAAACDHPTFVNFDLGMI
jgi:hypothetical protein